MGDTILISTELQSLFPRKAERCLSVWLGEMARERHRDSGTGTLVSLPQGVNTVMLLATALIDSPVKKKQKTKSKFKAKRKKEQTPVIIFVREFSFEVLSTSWCISGAGCTQDTGVVPALLKLYF